ncbi:MAG: response regulator [Chitinophagaceae bacterium]|nr:response regulator [Chitinophagaceae bacterium]
MKRKILVIEDEYIIANQIKLFLESENYDVIGPADNYADGCRLVDESAPDLIIADIRLYDDLDAGIRISEYVYKKYTIPVIFLSGYSDAETLSKAKATNPNTFLIKPKPLDKPQLLATVKIALPESIHFTKHRIISLKGKLINIESGSARTASYENTTIINKVFNFDEIIFIESYNQFFKNTILIHTADPKYGFLIREELDDFYKTLPSQFIRIHKSYIANSKKITGYKISSMILIGDMSLPIGEKNREEVTRFLNSSLCP